MTNQEKPGLLALPAEIRESIYRFLLNPDANRVLGLDEYNDYNYRDSLVLFKLNQQIYYEARRVFRDLNVFVKIETPWAEAGDHVAMEGHVPILMKGRRAAKFMGYSMSVVIDAPQMALGGPIDPQHIVILLDDLDKFTKTWYYADLSNTGLNRHLSLKLHIRDPYTPDWDEKRVPKWLQRRLLLPFGAVKNLGEVVIAGDPKPLPSIESELRQEQAVPPASPENCLDEATRLKLDGNKELNAGNYNAALGLYQQAWEAMHIIVKGRQRHVHGEAFFARPMYQDPWKGKDGRMERLFLRVQLVANTCLAYLKLEDYDEVRFWGMRTIITMRQNTLGPADRDWDVEPEDEAVTTFPVAVQLGKIYYRTALAFKALKDKNQARKLLRVAAVYLPRDERVRHEIANCTPRLG